MEQEIKVGHKVEVIQKGHYRKGGILRIRSIGDTGDSCRIYRTEDLEGRIADIHSRKELKLIEGETKIMEKKIKGTTLKRGMAVTCDAIDNDGKVYCTKGSSVVIELPDGSLMTTDFSEVRNKLELPKEDIMPLAPKKPKKKPAPKKKKTAAKKKKTAR